MRFIEYFIKNTRLNHLLLLFVLMAGIYSYKEMPKELFPDVTLNMIGVSGGYAGSSARVLDKMAVRDIEEAIEGISGIKTTETLIVPGRFDIILTLNDEAEPVDVLSKVKDAIAASRQYLPADMTEPLKRRIMQIENIAEVKIYGDSDEEILLKIDSKALAAYGIDPKSLLAAISSLSYIYPVGDIEQPGDYLYLSTVHGWRDEKTPKGTPLPSPESFTPLWRV